MNDNDRQTNLDRLWQQGQQLKAEGNLDQAIAIFKQLIETDPDAALGYHFLGECFAQQNYLSKAIKAYQQAIKLDSHNPWTYHCLGQVLFWQGNTSAAITHCEKSIQIEPNQPAFYTQLGQYLSKIEATDKAIAAYQEAIKLDPNVPDSVYSQLISLMLIQEQVQAALEINHSALEYHPDSAKLYFEQGNIFTTKKSYQKAIISYQKAVELQSNFWDAYQNLGNVLQQLNRSQEATEAYQLAEINFYQAQTFTKADLPLDFDWQVYLALNPEFQFSSKFEAIAHLMNYGLQENKLYSLKHLHDSQKRPDIAPQSIVQSEQVSVESYQSQPTKLAVLVHIYYFDLWSELCEYIQNIESEFDLYINIVATIWQPDMHQVIRADFPNANILISPNRGRDLGGHLSLMAHLDFAQYNLFCLIHTKKSPHIDPRVSNIWRRDLLNALLGSKAKASHNLTLMNHYPHIGLIGSRYWRSTAIGDNLRNYQYLLEMFGIKETFRNCEYLSGTMMLIRSSIMEQIYEKLHNLELESGDEQELGFHIDGQVAHAIERIIGNLVRDRGLAFFWQE